MKAQCGSTLSWQSVLSWQSIMLIVVLLVVPSIIEARDPQQVRVFRQTHACPVTGKTTGACPGWVVDHAYPLCAGGADSPGNMMWQETRQSYVKDRIERELCACRGKK